ncbi:MAG: hypothetical protein ACPHF4_16030, partial [Rubripirellula sp.]
MGTPSCPTLTDLTRMATGVLYRRSDEVRVHLESCDMCSRRLDEIMQQNQVLERRLTKVTLDDVEAAG